MYRAKKPRSEPKNPDQSQKTRGLNFSEKILFDISICNNSSRISIVLKLSMRNVEKHTLLTQFLFLDFCSMNYALRHIA